MTDAAYYWQKANGGKGNVESYCSRGNGPPMKYINSMKTLYLSDLDGTMIRSNERISAYTANTVNRFVRNGGCFSYATARSMVTASKVTAGLNAEFPVICYNGAFIIENKTKKLLQTNYFTLEETKAIRHALTKIGFFPIVYAYINGKESFSYIERNVSEGMRLLLNKRLDDVRRREVRNEDDLYCGDVFYFSCIGEETQLAPIYDMFKAESHVQCIYQKDIYSEAYWCELLPKEATKANAAIRLKTMLDCHKLVVFGDGRNDLSLFSVADESYAMENAVPELKEIATGVIDSNDNDGVARWLEDNIL